MTQVLAGNTLLQGLRPEFAGTYQVRMAGVEKRIGDMMQLGIPSDKLTEYFAYFQTAPYPVRWRRGDPIPTAAFDSKQFNVTNYDYGRRIPWHENDEADDQLRALIPHVKTLAEHCASHPSRMLLQMITGATDDDLLPTIPNAPDGAAIYAAQDGDSNDRFGVSGGNIITGSGISSSTDIRNDFFNAVERFGQFQDTEGQPLFPGEIMDGAFTVLYNIANSQVVNEAFKQGRTVQVVQNVGGTENVAAAAVTNIVMDSGMTVRLNPTQRIGDNDMYVFAHGAPIKPLFQLIRKETEEDWGLRVNSDVARTNKINYYQVDFRQGYGVALPYGTVKINN